MFEAIAASAIAPSQVGHWDETRRDGSYYVKTSQSDWIGRRVTDNLHLRPIVVSASERDIEAMTAMGQGVRYSTDVYVRFGISAACFTMCAALALASFLPGFLPMAYGASVAAILSAISGASGAERARRERQSRNV